MRRAPRSGSVIRSSFIGHRPSVIGHFRSGDPSMTRHCVATIRAIVAENRNDRRSVLQLGYNLGRLSELTGLGREPFWDRWKDAVASWDRAELDRLARQLRNDLESGDLTADDAD